MGRADQRTIAAGTPVAVLMERAGRAVAWEVRRTTRGGYGRRAVVVCGKGNNGGDGLITASALARWGMQVQVAELASGIDRRGLSRALGARRRRRRRDVRHRVPRRARRRRRVVRRRARPRGAGRVVAVDIPSGVDGLTGVVRGTAVRADEHGDALRPGSRASSSSRAGRTRGRSGSSTSASISASTATTRSRSPATRRATSPARCRPDRRPPTSG